jgi:nucleoside-diphosphate-sugar epimerase
MLGEFDGRARVVVLRPTTVLGPDAPLLFGHSAHVRLSDFDPPQQFTWVGDVAAAFGLALHSGAAGTFNVGAPGTVRTSEIASVLGVRDIRLPYRVRHALASLAGRAGGLHPGFVEMARYPIVVDSSRAEAELGWSAKLDSVSALRRFGEQLGTPTRRDR